MRQIMPLQHDWTLRLLRGDAPEDLEKLVIPAQVPGVVHTDLLAAGLIDDPYLDENEAALRWIWRTDWEYATTFTHSADDDDRVDLVCLGLDSIAQLELNGHVLGETRNMHRTYRFDIRDHLRIGTNRLVVRFRSALDYADAERERMGPLPLPNSATVHPINVIRKMASNFGWDWGPVLITVGIWKPIMIERWSTARLAQVRPDVAVDGGSVGSVGRVRVMVDLERTSADIPLVLRSRVAGHEASITVEPGATGAVLELAVTDPDLWWPHTYGDQPLYDLCVDLEAITPDGSEPLDSWHRRIGFRTIELDTRADDLGSAFTLVVNGLPIFARGANWIPDDCFPSRIGTDRYRTRLTQARCANIDLLRVWGGGIFESDDFYDACDDLGILVWQDFLFACAAYPEEEPIRSEVEAEARENVARLMPHPSLALWNGNNENFMGWHEWGWPEKVGDRTWGLGYYVELLPAIVAEVDGRRPYWPGSPYSGSPDRPSGLDGYGCKHVWDVWNRVDYLTYRDYVPRFVSEFGWQAPPTWATLTRFVHDEQLAPDSPGVLAHQKATDGNGKLSRGLAPHFPEPQSMADWHFANQLNQSRAIAVAIEHFRAHRGACMGTIIWQINDCWPVTSWAAIDGDGRLKPLWYTLRRVYADRLITFQPSANGVDLVMVNDARGPWASELIVQRRHRDGQVLGEWTTNARVGPASVERQPVDAVVGGPTDPAREYLVAMAGASRATWFFVEDKDFAYPEPAFGVSVSDDGTRVTVTAEVLLRDLALFADRLHPDATVDDMLVTLLPGESHTFTVTGTRVSPADLTSAVLRTAADVA